jgi:hypothetical protein
VNPHLDAKLGARKREAGSLPTDVYRLKSLAGAIDLQEYSMFLAVDKQMP